MVCCWLNSCQLKLFYNPELSAQLSMWSEMISLCACAEVFDTEGRFVPEKFEEIFSKYDKENKGGLSW